MGRPGHEGDERAGGRPYLRETTGRAGSCPSDARAGPGLTLVVGRNGSGKSSFAEGLELLLTGDTYRWSQRSKVWRDGWRNLHHPKAALAAEFALEGEKGACTLAREWADGAELTGASTWTQVHGQPRTGPEALGWETPLEAYRPFLSYNELGSLLDEGPSKLYDALVDTQTALQQARSARDKARKDADQERKALLARLEDREELKRATAAARTQINFDGELLKTAEPLSLVDLADKVQRSLPEPALSAVVLSSPWESR